MREDEVPNNLLKFLCQRQWELDVSSWLDGLIGHFVSFKVFTPSTRPHVITSPSPSSFLSFLLYESRYSIFIYLLFFYFFILFYLFSDTNEFNNNIDQQYLPTTNHTLVCTVVLLCIVIYVCTIKTNFFLNLFYFFKSILMCFYVKKSILKCHTIFTIPPHQLDASYPGQ